MSETKQNPSSARLAQADALRNRVGVYSREDLCVVEVRGEDQRSWLNGQVTNDVRDPQPQRGIYALATNVKGRILADLWVVGAPDHAILLAPKAAWEALQESFDKYIIMEDVELAKRDDLRVLSLQGPQAADLMPQLDTYFLGWAACDELGYGGYLAWTSAASFEPSLQEAVSRANALGGCAVDEDGVELARLRAGRPRFGRDFGIQQYPQEAGLKERTVSFEKGCYLGQEVICMLENRGQVSRRLVALELAASSPDAMPAAQTPLLHEGQQVGFVSSCVWDPEAEPAGRLLGYVKRAQAEPGQALALGDQQTTVTRVIGS